MARIKTQVADSAASVPLGLEEEIISDLLLPIATLSLDDEALRIMLAKLKPCNEDVFTIKSNYAKQLGNIAIGIYDFWSQNEQRATSAEIISLCEYRQAKQCEAQNHR